MKPYTPPKNGGFLILRCSDRVALGFIKEKNRWELPGGGEEKTDRGDLLAAAIRETQEELLLRVEREATTLVGNLVQVIPGTEGQTGIAGVWSSQVFEPNSGLIWQDFNLFAESHFASTDETYQISLARMRDIFCEDSEIIVPLGHKRMILHALNVWEAQKPLDEGIRLGNQVTALVPYLGSVTC